MATTPVEMQRDPVCGMQVDPAKARATASHAGKDYFFCCPGCAAKFNASPETYLAPRPKPTGMSLPVLGASPVAHKAPMQQVAHPAAPPAARAADQEIEYTCPMDPQIVQRGPGICPICGM